MFEDKRSQFLIHNIMAKQTQKPNTDNKEEGLIEQAHLGEHSKNRLVWGVHMECGGLAHAEKC